MNIILLEPANPASPLVIFISKFFRVELFRTSSFLSKMLIFESPQVNEVPCVVEAGVENFSKTKQAVTLMKAIGAYDDVEKAKESRKVI